MRSFRSAEFILCILPLVFSVLSALFVSSAFGAPGIGAPVPDKRTAQTMIYETMITINNAMMTNNFTVLHDMGAPAFQKRYRIEDLTRTFAGLREKKVDLKPVLLLKPQILKSQYLSEQRIFRLRGYMPTAPVRLHFEFHYQYVGSQWKLFALNLRFNRPMVTGDVTTAK